ncbi:hypothetical protein [Alloactinosynnema sp. L-07]|nr:hypothetical protein [Alloactinosynnema sp. L-07]
MVTMYLTQRWNRRNEGGHLKTALLIGWRPHRVADYPR